MPYKGGGAGHGRPGGMVDIYFGGLSTALPHVKSGKLRALARPRRRSAAAPDIPTIAESGCRYDAAISYGIFLPAGAPGR